MLAPHHFAISNSSNLLYNQGEGILFRVSNPIKIMKGQGKDEGFYSP